MQNIVGRKEAGKGKEESGAKAEAAVGRQLRHLQLEGMDCSVQQLYPSSQTSVAISFRRNLSA